MIPRTDEDMASRASDFLLHPPATDTKIVWYPGSRGTQAPSGV